jgi:AhpD family alkylhydroperoxidase
MSNETYPEKYHRLQSLAAKLSTEIPGSLKGFSELHQKSLQDGALPKKIKELMALAISITTPCAGCIAYHVHDALKAGGSREEVLETIAVAVMMAGGPGLVYGCEALEALDQFDIETGSKENGRS